MERLRRLRADVGQIPYFDMPEPSVPVVDVGAGLSSREWRERHCVIQDKDFNLVPLRLNSSQLYLDDVYWRLKEERPGEPVKIIGVKPRQTGWSTWWQSIIYEQMCRRANTYALTMANEDKSTSWLFQMSRRFAELDPEAPRLAYSSKQEVVFTAPLRSRNAVQVAHGHAGSGQTARIVHASEESKWPSPEETWLSMAQATKRADAFRESTGNGTTGIGAHFYRAYVAAVEGKSDYVAAFRGWHQHEEYRLPEVGATFDRWASKTPEEMGWAHDGAEEEDALVEHFGLTPGQVAWRRSTIATDCEGDLEKFHQEYPATWEEAFTKIAGRRVFSISLCRARKLRQVREPIAVGRLVWGVPPKRSSTGDATNRSAMTVGFVGDAEGPLTVWEWPPDDA